MIIFYCLFWRVFFNWEKLVNIFWCVSLWLFSKCFCSLPMPSLSHPHPSLFSSLSVSISHVHFCTGVHTKTLNEARLLSLFIEALSRWVLRTVLGYECVSLSLCPSLLFSASARRCVWLQQFRNVLLLFLRGFFSLRYQWIWCLCKARPQCLAFLFLMLSAPQYVFFFYLLLLFSLLCIPGFPALCPSPLFLFFQNAEWIFYIINILKYWTSPNSNKYHTLVLCILYKYCKKIWFYSKIVFG